MRNWIRKQFLKIGWDVSRVESRKMQKRIQREALQREKWEFLNRYQPSTILDIGANVGQFAKLVRPICPTAKLISFEPLKGCYKTLQGLAEQLKPYEAVHTALGAENSTTTINRNEFTPSSSLLEMEKLHHEESPQTTKTVPEEITVRRLDDVVLDLEISSPLFIKIDVQGFEHQVLLGGKETICKASAVVLEVSAYALYQGEAGFDVIYDLLRSWGFSYRGNVDQWVSKKDQRILQFDCLFENDQLSDDQLSESSQTESF